MPPLRPSWSLKRAPTNWCLDRGRHDDRRTLRSLHGSNSPPARRTKLIDDGKLTGGKRIHIHLIEAEDVISKLAASSKMNAEWRFMTYLFNVGRERADKWLTDNFDSIGSKSTIDLDDKYM